MKKYLKRTIIFCALLCSACSNANYYACINEAGDERVNFSWNNERITKNHIDFYFPTKRGIAYLNKNYADLLKPDMQGGTYNVKKTASQVTVRYIQDTVLTKMQLPSKEIKVESNALWNELYLGTYPYIDLYHAIVPSINEYVFYIQKEQLTLTIDYSFPARKVSKLRKAVGSDGRIHTTETTPVSTAQYWAVFAKKETTHSTYPNCTRDAGIIGFLNHVLDVILFP